MGFQGESVPQDVLQRRWQEAKQSASNAHHVKIERLCTHCLLTTGQLQTLMPRLRKVPARLRPHPPRAMATIGCAGDLSQTVWRNDTPTRGPAGGACSASSRQNRTHGPGQWPDRTAPLEKHLLDMLAEGFQNLRDQVEQSLTAAKRELQARRPEGATLDQAIARQRQASKARSVAETHVQDTTEALKRAEHALQVAIEAEQSATQEVQRVRTLIAEAEPPGELKPPSLATVPPQALSGLFQFLQLAGLNAQQLANVGHILGATMPPLPAGAPAQETPPPQAQLQPGSGQGARLGSPLLATEPSLRNVAPAPQQGALGGPSLRSANFLRGVVKRTTPPRVDRAVPRRHRAPAEAPPCPPIEARLLHTGAVQVGLPRHLGQCPRLSPWHRYSHWHPALRGLLLPLRWLYILAAWPSLLALGISSGFVAAKNKIPSAQKMTGRRKCFLYLFKFIIMRYMTGKIFPDLFHVILFSGWSTGSNPVKANYMI